MRISNSQSIKFIQTASRIFVGVVFVFSGFVKAVDPSGFAIKLDEYFIAFQLGFLAFATLPLAILLSAVELTIGINLMIAVRMKLTSWLLLVFMSFFTVLTFILALTNPVSDCGCFGDAIKLTNWETFWKNIIILAPAVLIFILRNDFIPVMQKTSENIMAGLGFLASVLLSVYCIVHLPLVDFRPYSIGTNIPENMILPEGAPVDEYETILVYEKDGIEEEFTSLNYPWQDSTWIWIETRHKLIRKGDIPPIHDFSITSEEGLDITEDVLADPGYTFLLIAPDINKANARNMIRANELFLQCNKLNISFLCLSSSPGNEIRTFISKYHPDYKIYTMDETTIKTIIRANPGLVLLREGTILGKWNYRDAPRADEFKSNMISVSTGMQRRANEWLAVLIFSLIFTLIYGGVILLLRKK